MKSGWFGIPYDTFILRNTQYRFDWRSIYCVYRYSKLRSDDQTIRITWDNQTFNERVLRYDGVTNDIQWFYEIIYIWGYNEIKSNKQYEINMKYLGLSKGREFLLTIFCGGFFMGYNMYNQRYGSDFFGMSSWWFLPPWSMAMFKAWFWLYRKVLKVAVGCCQMLPSQFTWDGSNKHGKPVGYSSSRPCLQAFQLVALFANIYPLVI